MVRRCALLSFLASDFLGWVSNCFLSAPNYAKASINKRIEGDTIEFSASPHFVPYHNTNLLGEQEKPSIMSFRYSVAGPSTTYVRARTRHELYPYYLPTRQSSIPTTTEKFIGCEYCFLSALLQLTFVQIARELAVGGGIGRHVSQALGIFGIL
jgi:hypothetical protein